MKKVEKAKKTTIQKARLESRPESKLKPGFKSRPQTGPRIKSGSNNSSGSATQLAKPVASSEVALHPQTIKHLKKGHPWITKDSFTEKFPAAKYLLIGTHQDKAICSFIHDPTHPTVKGRIWNLVPPFVLYKRQFEQELTDRLKVSMEKRVSSKIHQRRDNFYLVFGEADLLPGLFVQKLGKEIIIQCYSFFWKQYQTVLLEKISKLTNHYYPNIFDERKSGHHCWIQFRSQKLKPSSQRLETQMQKTHPIINENGIKVALHLGETYDPGLYTDMSAIREKLLPRLVQAKVKKCLNLYAYSGVYSLFALQAGCEEVTSVDLSPKYLEWLEENLALNPELLMSSNAEEKTHLSLCQSVQEALPELLSTKKGHFDLIICDPPSSSTDHQNQKRSSLQQYLDIFPGMVKLLAPKGKMLLFHNGHGISDVAFKRQVEALYKDKYPLKVIATFKLSDDCPTMPTFPEGDYLKGILLEKY